MTGVNLKILSDWRSTLAVAFNVLRRLAFVFEDAFAFEKINTSIDWQGMTVTNVAVKTTSAFRVNNVYFFRLDIFATLAAPLAAQFYITLPITTPGTNLGTGATIDMQGGSCAIRNAGAVEVGLWRIFGGTNQIIVQRTPGGTAFGAGDTQIILNGFIEVV